MDTGFHYVSISDHHKGEQLGYDSREAWSLVGRLNKCTDSKAVHMSIYLSGPLYFEPPEIRMQPDLLKAPESHPDADRGASSLSESSDSTPQRCANASIIRMPSGIRIRPQE